MDDIRTLVQQIVIEAKRLGLVWDLKIATVLDTTNPEKVLIRCSGDQAVGVASPMAGLPAVGTRVYVVAVPPAGNYIVGSAVAQGPMNMTRRYLTELSGNTGLVAGATALITIAFKTLGGFAWEADSIVEFRQTAAAVTVGTSILTVNSVNETAVGVFQADGVPTRQTTPQFWNGTVLTGGDQTFVLSGTASGGNLTAGATHTRLRLRIYE